ncbi:hypothetical protein Ddc_00426 [Ditylenchus destructor]|nr:hypothetical protein Ddc_00426 [Ditylenchus destructor]
MRITYDRYKRDRSREKLHSIPSRETERQDDTVDGQLTTLFVVWLAMTVNFGRGSNASLSHSSKLHKRDVNGQ